MVSKRNTAKSKQPSMSLEMIEEKINKEKNNVKAKKNKTHVSVVEQKNKNKVQPSDKLDTSALLQDSESDSSSESDGGGRLLSSAFNKEKRQQKFSQSKREDRDMSLSEDDGSDTSNSVSEDESTRHHQVDHRISESEESTDSEIHKIAKKQSKFTMDDGEMSDFSILSPKKKSVMSPKNSKMKEKRKVLSKSTEHKVASESAKKRGDKKHTSDLSDAESSVSQSTPSKSGSHAENSKLSPKKKRKQKVTSDISEIDEVLEQNLDLRYKVPADFEPSKLTVSAADLRKEHQLAHSDLWLIKAPIDFDIQQLNGVSINLKGCTDLHTKNKNYYEVMGAPDTSNEMSSFQIILPSITESEFVPGPSFKGQIHVMQSLEIPPLPPIMRPAPVVHTIPEGLKPRFEPFGSDDPIGKGHNKNSPQITEKKKHRHKHDEKDSSQKHEKRKHCEEQDDIDLDHSETKKRKKEKKKRKE